MRTRHQSISVNDIDGLRVENDHVTIDILPSLGGKFVSLVDSDTGHEYLSKPSDTDAYRHPAYGDDFGHYDISGWDECFPAIGEGPHPAFPWKGIEIPDHGELWTARWRAEVTDSGVDMSVSGVRFPYVFERSLSLDENGFTLDYHVVNNTAMSFPYVWSAHPLLAATPSTRVLIPAETMTVEVSMTGRLGERLAQHTWPVTVDTSGNVVNLDVMGPRDLGEAEKLYSNMVTDGWAALFDGASEQWLAFLFDPDDVPFVGFWANRSGWPEDRPSFDIALEPCSGFPDRLDIATTHGAATFIPPSGERRWQVRVRIGRGLQNLEETLGIQLPQQRDAT